MAKIAIIVGTVYGASQNVAEEAQVLLQSAGHQIALYDEPNLDTLVGFNADIWMVVTSTTGQGDLPENIVPFFYELKDRFPLLNGKAFVVIGLGDTGYDVFCAAAEKFREVLLELQGRELIPMLRIDAGETLSPETIALPWLKKNLSALISV